MITIHTKNSEFLFLVASEDCARTKRLAAAPVLRIPCTPPIRYHHHHHHYYCVPTTTTTTITTVPETPRESVETHTSELVIFSGDVSMFFFPPLFGTRPPRHARRPRIRSWHTSTGPARRTDETLILVRSVKIHPAFVYV